MSQLPLVHTSTASQAVSAIHKLVEPFSFEWRGEYQDTDVHVTGAMLERVKIFGVCHGAPVLVRSSPLRSHYIVLPLQGEVTGTFHQTVLRAASGEALVFPAGGRLHAHWGERCVAIVLSIGKQSSTGKCVECRRSPIFRFAPQTGSVGQSGPQLSERAGVSVCGR